MSRKYPYTMPMRDKAEIRTDEISLFEELIVKMSSMLFESESGRTDAIIDESLQRIGEFAGVDRAYVFRYDATMTTMSNTHEWCAPGISAEKDNLQELPLTLFPKWTEVLASGGFVYAPYVPDMGEGWEAEREILTMQHVQSVFVVPISAGGTQYGFMGFDTVNSRLEWREDMRRMLGVFAHTLAVVWGRHERELALQLALAKAQQAAAVAEQADKAKTDFLSLMSHEIRTPLNGVIGMTRLLLGTGLDERQRRYADMLRASGDQLMAVVSQILEYSKIEAGRLSIVKIPFDPGKTMRDAMEAFRAQAAAKGLGFEFIIDRQVPALVLGDPARFLQVVGNIAANAVKFTRQGGVSARLSVRRWGAGVCELAISVRDTGPGISADFMPKLFLPFEQADASMSREYGGSGMGLPIADRICALMGGTIEVSGEMGKGSTFTVVLPFEAEATDSGSAAAAESGAESMKEEVRARYRENRRLASGQPGHLAGCDDAEDGPVGADLCLGLDSELRERLLALGTALDDQEPERCGQLVAALAILSKGLQSEAAIAEIAALISEFRFPEARRRVDFLIGAPA